MICGNSWCSWPDWLGAQEKPDCATYKASNQAFIFGAGEMNRTPDLLITNELLYRLSYTG
jgi:hypothetical protein